ncbi:MAG: hypothetical protein MJ229_07760 [bacterium]|nr:hypothetical protein [bacterium]
MKVNKLTQKYIDNSYIQKQKKLLEKKAEELKAEQAKERAKELFDNSVKSFQEYLEKTKNGQHLIDLLV